MADPTSPRRGPEPRLRDLPERQVVHVDFADLVRVAVENERGRVLREVRRRVHALPVSLPKRGSTWDSDPRPAVPFRDDVDGILDDLEEGR